MDDAETCYCCGEELDSDEVATGATLCLSCEDNGCEDDGEYEDEED